MLNARIVRLEREKRFREWLTLERFVEGLTEEQLELYAGPGEIARAITRASAAGHQPFGRTGPEASD